MTLDDLQELLGNLRYLKNDHQMVEAKEARDALPQGIHETLSAFANSAGGTILFGVKEGKDKAFAVTGVEDPSLMQSQLQAECALMDPPVRASIETVEHPSGAVVVATIPPIPRELRPCHRSGLEMGASSFTRVGDGDYHLSPQEIQVMLAERTLTDYSRGNAAEGATLDQSLLSNFLHTQRSREDEQSGISDETLLKNMGVQNSPGVPTLAGVLTLGENPQLYEPSARLTFRSLPKPGDPPGAQYHVATIEGTIGVIFDQTLSMVSDELGEIVVSRNGHKFNELDVPKRAIREILSNALIHRSFTHGCRGQNVVVQVSDATVEITSPGNLPASANPTLLGVEPASGVRNNALDRLCGLLDTPSGFRITEHQASGIAESDFACRESGTMPALFIDGAATFKVILIRGSLDEQAAAEILEEAGAPITEALVRLVSVAQKLESIKSSVIDLKIDAISFDPQLAARALSSSTLAEAIILIGELERFGVLRRVKIGNSITWVLPESPEFAQALSSSSTGANVGKAIAYGERERVADLVIAIGSSDEKELSPKEIGEALGLTSSSTRRKWITNALTEGFIATESESPFDPHITYHLTSAGKARFKSLQSRKKR